MILSHLSFLSEEEEYEEEEEYDELDYREEGQFWNTHDEPVGSAESPVFDPDSEDERRPTPEPVIGLFAIGKLCRYQHHLDSDLTFCTHLSCNHMSGWDI